MTIPVPPIATPLRWLGGQIDVKVEIDTGAGGGFAGLWDEGIWDTHLWGTSDPDWQDLTRYVIVASTQSGAERWGERFQAGTASILVDNTSGIFTPDLDVVSPFFREYRLGRRIRIVAIPDPDNPVKVPLFIGRIDSSSDTYDDPRWGATTRISCIDHMGVWAAFNPLEGPMTGDQRTDERVHAALDRMDWVGRDIQEGSHNVQTAALAQTTLEECQRAADAEGGAFFASPDGLATFKNRDWLTTDTRSVEVQGYVGYDEIPSGAQAAHALHPRTSWELARVRNDIQFARANGTMQQVEDLPSQQRYEKRSYPRTDFRNTTDLEVLALATRYLNSFKDARMRVDEVTIEAVDDPNNDDLNRLLWDTRLGDRLAVMVSPPHGWAFEREVHVMGITHTITHDSWLSTFRLDDAQALDMTFWVLQDPVFGVLGDTTRLASA